MKEKPYRSYCKNLATQMVSNGQTLDFHTFACQIKNLISHPPVPPLPQSENFILLGTAIKERKKAR